MQDYYKPIIMSMDRKIENKGRRWRRSGWIAGLAVIISLVFFQLVFGDRSSRLNVDKEKITIDIVREDAFLDYITAIGTVEPIQTIFLDATEGGRVEEIFRREGGMVAAGEPLARLSNTTLLLDISNAETSHARTVNDMRMFRVQVEQQKLSNRSKLLDLSLSLSQYERRYRNYKKLIEQNHISQEDYEISKEQYDITIEKMKLYRETYKQDSIYRALQFDAIETSLKNIEENILKISSLIIDKHSGIVPDTMEELLSLPGVGRKTANLVITLGFGKQGICVDTHVHRITNRLGYVKTKMPDETELALRAKLPEKWWIPVSDILIAFGQVLCRPVSPFCSKCKVNAWCGRCGVSRSR